MMVFYINIYLC